MSEANCDARYLCGVGEIGDVFPFGGSGCRRTSVRPPQRLIRNDCSSRDHVICARACSDTNEIKRCPICRGSVEIFQHLFWP